MRTAPENVIYVTIAYIQYYISHLLTNLGIYRPTSKLNNSMPGTEFSRRLVCLLVIILGLQSPSFAAATTWYVNDTSTVGDSYTTSSGSDGYAGTSPSTPFRTIIKALNSAMAGDTILIDAGYFDSYMTVSASESAGIKIDTNNLTIVGKDSVSTVIVPRGQSALDMADAGVYGIYADTQTGLSIKNLAVTGAYYGIMWVNVDFSTISGDSLGGNGYSGIHLLNGSDTNTITGNNTSTNQDNGIYLLGSSYNTLTSNTANGNAIAGFVLSGDTGNTLTNNTANSNVNQGFYLSGSMRDKLTGNIANLNTGHGFYLFTNSNENTLTGNTAKSNSNHGLNLLTSSSNAIAGNTFNANSNHGINVQSSSNNVLIQNTLMNNTQYQIYITGSASSDTIQKNNIKPGPSNTDSGVYAVSTVAGNKFTLTRNWWNTADSAAIRKMIFQPPTSESVVYQPYRIATVDTLAGADTTAPKSPDTVAIVGAPSDTSIIVSWSDVTQNEENVVGGAGLLGYRVYRSAVKDTSSWIKVAQVSSAVTLWQDTNVLLGVNYYYRVTAFDTVTPFDNESFFSDSQPFAAAMMASQKNWFVNDTYTGSDSFTAAGGSDTAYGQGTAQKPFRSIPRAMQFATAGDTIWVDAGFYDSFVKVSAMETAGIKIDTDNITIIGKDSASTTIDPPGDSTISGLYGIYADTQTGLLIKNLGVTGAYDGVQWRDVDLSTIAGNSFNFNFRAVYLRYGSDTNTVTNNTFNLNLSSGIELESSSNNTVSGNAANSGGYGIQLGSSSNNNTLTGNTANLNSWGITLSASSNNALTGNTANSNLLNGIDLSSSSNNNTVTSNTANSNSGVGIYLSGSNNTVTTNTVALNLDAGIYVTWASANMFVGNMVKSNAGSGIELDGITGGPCDDNSLIGNTILSNSGHGIRFWSANYNLLVQNTIDSNLNYQVCIDTASMGDTPAKNNIRTSPTNPDSGVYNNTGNVFDFARNWWFTTDEVAIAKMIFDTATPANIKFRPYRFGPVDTAPGADTTAPGLVSGIALDTSVPTQITVSWVNPVVNEETNGGGVGFAGLNIFRTVNVPDTTNWHNSALLVKQTLASETFWIDTTVFAGNTYYYRMTSKDSATPFNESFFTDTKFITLPSTNPAGVIQILDLGDNQPAPDVVPGETMVLQVIDTGVNVNPVVAETLVLRLKNLVTNEQETAILTEIDTNNAVFNLKFRFSADPADNSSGNGRMYVVGGDTVQFDYTDPTDAADTKQVKLAVGVILVGNVQAADTQIAQGDTAVIFRVTVANELPNDPFSAIDTLTSVKITFISVPDTYVKVNGVKMWLDTGILGKLEPQIDAQLGTATIAGGECTFPVAGPSTVFAQGDTRHFLFSIEILDSVPVGDTLDAKILKGGVGHILTGAFPDTDINSPGVLIVIGSKANVLVGVSYDTISTPASYNGLTGDTIPGAMMLVSIKYDNDGSDTAVGFSLNARIPQFTTLAQADSSLVSAHFGSQVTVTVTDDSGAILSDTDPAARRIRWTFSTGVGSTNGDPVGSVDATAADIDAGIVRYKVYIK